MSTPTIDFDDFIMFSLEEATRIYHRTTPYHILNTKLEQMTEDCKHHFNEEDYHFIETCFETILEAEGNETSFAYLQSYKDCVALLKRLELL